METRVAEERAGVRRLPEEIIRGIAAGEVVERPASVLKELMENALDAGARNITVEWREAGRERLCVTDDGSGMSPQDARLALERHATSKIRSLADLERVGTYGFRGEALPSIAAACRFEMVTRTPGAETAWRVSVEGGGRVEEAPAAGPPGTRVSVRDLFFNVPARLKFLKSDATERALLMRTLEDCALSAPGVGFRVLAEGREVLSLSAETPETLTRRLALLWGRERAQSLRAVEAAAGPLSVRGWVTEAGGAQPTARHQRWFINRRPVSSRRLTHALYDAYRGSLPAGRHPASALFLEIDPALVDVNVHPAKREVRLSSEEQVHDAVSGAVRRALSENVAEAPAPPSVPEARPRAEAGPSLPPAALARETPTLFPGMASPAGTSQGPDLPRFRQARFEVLAQVHATYIVARWEGELFLFDQHAAAERALYERLSRSDRGGRQALLLPWVWEPSAEASAAVSDARGELDGLGFSLDAFGGTAWRVTGVPAALGEGRRVRDVLEGLIEDRLLGRIPRGLEAMTVRAACRGSVMAGEPLAPAEMGKVIGDLQAAERPWTCPHGRPTFLRVGEEELARRFRRV